MTTPIVVSLATSTASRIAAVNALALLAAVLVAVSVVGILVAWVLFDPCIPRPYRLGIAPSRSTARLSANQDIPHAA